MNDPIFYKPFGPVIYSNTLDSDIFEILKECQAVSETVGENTGYLLAGALKLQLNLIRTPEQNDIIFKHIIEHLALYVNGDPAVVAKKWSLTDNTIWLNIQQSGEFNPVHHHKGDVSGVIYLDMPLEIEEENANNDINSKKHFFSNHGGISFYYGEDISCPTYHHVTPITGQILLFPAKLKHSVHPFYSKVNRVSLAFNLWKEQDSINVKTDKDLQ
jgi:uncharacterized protein (TIGR02466 family)